MSNGEAVGWLSLFILYWCWPFFGTLGLLLILGFVELVSGHIPERHEPPPPAQVVTLAPSPAAAKWGDYSAAQRARQAEAERAAGIASPQPNPTPVILYGQTREEQEAQEWRERIRQKQAELAAQGIDMFGPPSLKGKKR
jgi:hypothetical protein